jgi:hypothetical protein
MTDVNVSVMAMAIRMRPLPRRHRVAHLRALVMHSSRE